MTMEEIVRKIAEKCSRADARVNDLDLVHLRPYIEGFLDSQWLESQLCDYNAWASKNSDDTLRRAILHRPLGTNVLIAMIWAARSWEREYRSNASLHPGAGAKRLLSIACSMAVLERHAGDLFDREAREYIRQRLQAERNLVGVVHEVNAAAHFVCRGASVEPLFLKKANEKEILVHWAGESIPVQCKAKQPGAGRLIPQDMFTTLAGSIAHDVKLAKRRLLVRIGTTGPIREQDFEFLRSCVLDSGGRYIAPALIQHDDRVFSLKVEPISGLFTIESVKDYLASFGFQVGMIVGEPARGGTNFNVVCVIGIEARVDDRLKTSRSLRESIRTAADQLTGGPPGIIAIHYADPVPDFEALRAGDGPLKYEMYRMMDPWPHVGAIMLSSEPDFQPLPMGHAGKVHSYVREPDPFADLLGPRITR
jgi:hypothetical protein